MLLLLFWVYPRPRPPPALSSLVFCIRSLARCALYDKENRPPLTRTKGYALQVLGVVEVLVVDNLQRVMAVVVVFVVAADVAADVAAVAAAAAVVAVVAAAAAVARCCCCC